MSIERITLFSTKKEFLSFFTFCLFILSCSLLISYQDYKNLTRFDSALVDATVLKQYEKTKDSKIFQVLKLKTSDGITFYSGTKKSTPMMIGKNLSLEIWAGEISFYEYLTSFYAYNKIIHIDEQNTKQRLNQYIESMHHKSISSQSLTPHIDSNMSNIYQALYTATPLNKELQSAFSFLGISHLLAISGFHLGVLSGILFFFFRPIYKFFQNRYFPYRNSKSDIFILVASVLFTYLIFLDSPPSLLRAFTMLILGFILYDRGIKIISMQTLFLTLMLLLSFFPKLFFALGFWLSIVGVFYIFLFLIHFKNLSKIWQFILIPFWVYIMMLPYSLVVFGSFSLYHPLSIIWTSLFTIFYPLSIAFHIVGWGEIFDGILKSFLSLSSHGISLHIDKIYLYVEIVLSLFSIFFKRFIYLLFALNLYIFLYAISYVV